MTLIIWFYESGGPYDVHGRVCSLLLGMAFPIPSHLPRKKDQDVSTELLSKMSETTSKSLTHGLASSWVAELNVAIRQTKVLAHSLIRIYEPSKLNLLQDKIHDRMQADLPSFERQLASSMSVQERLRSLAANVDVLSSTLSNSEVRPIRLSLSFELRIERRQACCRPSLQGLPGMVLLLRRQQMQRSDIWQLFI